jgi:hypothetical protein
VPDTPENFDVNRVDVTCPGVSQPKGAMPPNGFERWCERDDGKRHGPASLWNAADELVRTVEYRDGEAVAVRFLLPESELLPLHAFMCPSGQIERSEDSGASQHRWCETASGERSGPDVVWEGGRVVLVAAI